LASVGTHYYDKKNYCVSQNDYEFISASFENFKRAEEKTFTKAYLEHEGRRTHYMIWFLGEFKE
jgi:hypothetical protein